MEKKLKIILCTVLMILIILVGFIGVYTNDGVLYKNQVPRFSMASEFNGKRITTLKLSESTEEVIYDKDGNEVEKIPEGANEEDYKKETKSVNREEKLTKENYEKVKEILEGRLKILRVKDYLLRVDENTGKVELELEEGLNTDTIIQYLLCKGDFAIRDVNEGTVYLDNNDLKKANVLYANTSGEGVSVYFSMEFNKEGKAKLLDVSKKYLKPEGEDNLEEQAKSDEGKVALRIEGNDVLKTFFGEEISNGLLRITLGTSKDNEEIQEYIEQGEFYSMLINNEEMPLTYEVESTGLVKGEISGNKLQIIIAITAVIIALAFICIIAKYKLDGLISVFTMIAGYRNTCNYYKIYRCRSFFK